MKTSRIALAVVLVAAVAVVTFVFTQTRVAPPSVETEPQNTMSAPALAELAPLPTISTSEPLPPPVATAASQPAVTEPPPEKPAPATNKLERLAQIRETFRALAAGDKTNALRAAKQITDETERETALLTLVTEWTQGELGPARLRAERIARVGLEAGIGMELAKHPELAVLWADEMTEGDGRANVLQVTARFLVNSDPAAAFALSQRLPESERRNFSNFLLADWAQKDTEAAMKWAEQFPDAAEREAALQAIRSVAPVGIGTALEMKDGYPVINGLVPGTPAALSGQLQVGDRIIALAQGGGPFVDAYEAPFEEIIKAIRGAPNTLLQLKILPAGAAPNAPAKTVSIMRDQIKFKK
jgi:hypothetical protein